jgi:AraC-like DNA-binding protein
VKVLRLNDVRRQLLSYSHVCRSISELALDAGFTHLSQFAMDYKKLFLESPSMTRRRIAVAGLAPQAAGAMHSEEDQDGRRHMVSMMLAAR